MFNMERYRVADADLENWVKFIWHFETDNAHVHHKLLPMDSIDIIMNLADEMEYETASGRISRDRRHVNNKEASKKIFTDPAAGAFVKSLDSQSVKMLILPQIKTWMK